MRIYASLKHDSIKSAIAQLEKYKTELRRKQDIFLEELALSGIPIIDESIATAAGDADKTHYTFLKVRSFGDYSQATLTVEGKDVVLFEFGAGIYYNGGVGTSARRSEEYNGEGLRYKMLGGEEIGYTIGSYGKGQGSKEYWFYYADTGESVMSRGTEATTPLQNATMEMISNIVRIARKVYGK